MIGLAHVTRVSIPRTLLEQGHTILREIGEDGREGLVLWAGRTEGEAFSVHAVLQPVQRGIRGQDGLLVLVDGAELHRVGVWLYTHGLQLVAQVHSHPTDAYHSDTDDAIPIVTTEGGLSLVVPNFARGDATLVTYAVYRLDERGTWGQLSSNDVRNLIHIEESA